MVQEGVGSASFWLDKYSEVYRFLEIIASTRLRDALQLTNGSIVTIEIPIEWEVGRPTEDSGS